jgi:hypothetical protein
LLYNFAITQALAAELVRSGFELYALREFWVNAFFGVALFGSNLLLAYLAATAMITLATENRSTPLRVALLVQQAVFIAWSAYFWIDLRFDNSAVLLLAQLGAVYWFAMGSMLSGERPEMSRRAMRSLPQNGVGRLFFTWLRPGPSSGFAFAVANLTMILVLCLLATTLMTPPPRNMTVWPNPDRFFYVIVLGWSYVVLYLGLGCLVVALLRKIAEVTMFASVLLHLLLLLAGSGIPTSIHWMSLELQNEPYSYLQVTNPIWTLGYVLEFSPAPEEPVLLVLIPAAAVCALMLNLPGLIRELERSPTALPARLIADEAELHPPPESLPQNPWDEPQSS